MSATLDLSIIICTHNRALDLRETLASVAEAIAEADGYACEVIVCANGCTDSTVQVLEEFARVAALVPFKSIIQEKPGKSGAFRSGVLAARGRFLMMLDDDNTLFYSWIKKSISILEEQESVGVVGCHSKIPESLVIPGEIKPFLSSYAIGEQSGMGLGVWGAGMVLRAEPLRPWFLCGQKLLLSGRVGRGLIAGEDTEICLMYAIAGLSTKAVPVFGIIHRVAQNRLTVAYLKRLWASEGAAFQVYRGYIPAISLFDTEQGRIVPWVLIKEVFRNLCVLPIFLLGCLATRRLTHSRKIYLTIGRISGLWALVRGRYQITDHLSEFKKRFQSIRCT